jgi:hypothetical protein
MILFSMAAPPSLQMQEKIQGRAGLLVHKASRILMLGSRIG